LSALQSSGLDPQQSTNNALRQAPHGSYCQRTAPLTLVFMTELNLDGSSMRTLKK